MKLALPLTGLVTIIVLITLQLRAVTPSSSPSFAPQTVQTQAVHTNQVMQSITYSGITRGAGNAHASFTLGGRMEQRPKDIGDQIRAGEVIAALDQKPHRNALAAARSALEEAQTRLAQLQRDTARVQALFDQEAATKEELEKIGAENEAVNAKVDALHVDVRELTRRLEETELRAPITGVITAVMIEPGEFAGPGTPVYAINSRDQIEVELELPESMIQHIQLGDRVPVRFPFSGQSKTDQGVITSVGESALGPGRLFPVIVSLPTQEVLPGMTVEVTLSRALDQGLSIPIRALVNPSGRSGFVYQIVDDTAVRVPVDVLGFAGDDVLVHAALNEGDAVIVTGHHSLLDGDAVAVRQGDHQ